MKRLLKIAGRFALPLVLTLSGGAGAVAQSWLRGSSLIDASMGAGNSAIFQQFATTGYELEDGTYQSLSRFYGNDWRDVRLVALTPVTEDTSLIWGGSTGERGDKYYVMPSVEVGLSHSQTLSEQGTLSLTGRLRFGGQGRELPCEANFSLGGQQTVNCRLAAGVLPPAETLNFLIEAPTPNWLTGGLNYRHRFWPGEEKVGR